MKKIIAILSVLFLMAISYTASAQYANKQKQIPPVTEVQSIMTAEDFLQSDMYQDALYESYHGRHRFFSGIAWSLVGATAMGIGVPMAYAEVEAGPFLVIGGGICTVVGTIMEISGISEWTRGEANLRNLRFEYTIRANGLAISF